MNIRSFPALVLFCAGISLPAALTQAREEASTPIYTSSFEEAEGYQNGQSVLGQNGWSIYAAHQNNAKIHFSNGGRDKAPAGNGMLRVSSGTPLVHRVLGEKPTRGSLTFTALTSVDFEGGGTVLSRFYLSGSRSDGQTNHRFMGASFGINEEGNGPRFFYRDGDTNHVLAEEYAVRSGAVYRFVSHVDVERGTYSVQVFEHGSAEPLGEASGIKLRGKLEAIDFLILQGSVGTSFDAISIKTP